MDYSVTTKGNHALKAHPIDLLTGKLKLRADALNAHGIVHDAKYVLIWLQQTLRGNDHPAIDAGVEIANNLGLPALVYHGVREDYPYASARLHRFILGASREMSRSLEKRGIACLQHIVRPGTETRGLVYKLADDAACVVTDRHATFVAKWQAENFARKIDRAVIAVDATLLVPHSLLPSGLGATKAFRAAHSALRSECFSARLEVAPIQPKYSGPFPFAPDVLKDMGDQQLDSLISQCRIDHSLPVSLEYPASLAAVSQRITLLTTKIIERYQWLRNNPADPNSSSSLSPYLHFGMASPFAILRALDIADVKRSVRWKFLDELLTWREWCHWRMTENPELIYYDSLPVAARRTMEDHSNDPRNVVPIDALLHGETPDETWNAAQKQWLVTGWMHNNLRMYWAKQILRWTKSPQSAWATACYLNDRLSLDGRDPATYVMMRWAFGEARPGYKELPIYGWIAPKSDGALRKRSGAIDWIATMAKTNALRIEVQDEKTWFNYYVKDK